VRLHRGAGDRVSTFCALQLLTKQSGERPSQWPTTADQLVTQVIHYANDAACRHTLASEPMCESCSEAVLLLAKRGFGTRLDVGTLTQLEAWELVTALDVRSHGDNLTRLRQHHRFPADLAPSAVSSYWARTWAYSAVPGAGCIVERGHEFIDLFERHALGADSSVKNDR
jgi:hypothetical protein